MSPQRVERILKFRLVTADLPRLVKFYETVLGMTVVGSVTPIDPAELMVLKLSGGGWRQRLLLGEQSVAIDAFEQPGRPYPSYSNAASLWFQHLALVVTDIAAAYRTLHDFIPGFRLPAALRSASITPRSVCLIPQPARRFTQPLG